MGLIFKMCNILAFCTKRKRYLFGHHVHPSVHPWPNICN